MLINALKYSFIEILYVLFKMKFKIFQKKGRGKNIDTNIQDLWEITLPISRRFIVRRKIVFIRSRRGGGGGEGGGEGR